MQPTDVKLARSQRNLRVLAECASRLSSKERSEPVPSDLRRVLPDADQAASSESASVAPVARKGRAAVVCWDLTHNPAGRALVLYQLLEKDWHVDLIGPQWTRYGKALWSPLKNLGLNVRSFSCESFEDFLPKADLLCASVKYDVVYICKPRLPSIYLGASIKKRSHCPVVLDVDDFELSFFSNESSCSIEEFRHSLPDGIKPYDEVATRYAQNFIGDFDGLTVSNVALQQKFGGLIVRHARDETLFKPDPERRKLARNRLGITDEQFALIFVGTPRAHKGILEVAKALESINDPAIVFHIIGTINDDAIKRQLEAYSNANIQLHDDCAFEELPFFLSAADLVPLIQNTEHAISQYQIPAKISDASALGVPVLATDTPPIKDLRGREGLEVIAPEQLVDKILQYKHSAKGVNMAARRFFLGELSLAVNSARASIVLEEAKQSNESLSSQLQEMLAELSEFYKRSRLESIPIARDRASNNNMAAKVSPALISLNKVVPKTLRDPLRSKISNIFSRKPGAGSEQEAYDLVFFWKQNDTGLFGRRSDMVVKYLSQSCRVRKILQLDAPYDASSTDLLINNGSASSDDCSIVRLHDRYMHLLDTDKVRYRTFLGSTQAESTIDLEETGDQLSEYSSFVLREMEKFGMEPDKTIGWFCPVIWNAPELIQQLGFRGVVSDLIDDQRAWKNDDATLMKLEQSYADVIQHSDLVMANCDSLAKAFNQYAPNIKIVPNGAERHADQKNLHRPDALKDLPGPVIGYVGTLRDRIDWMLLNDVVRQWPEASFVFVGPGKDSDQAKSLGSLPNVHMLGAIPYAEIVGYLQSFDVAMVPHIRNRLTGRMNPLKLYNYFAAGLPVVSTDVKNIEDLSAYISIADGADDFVAALKRNALRKVDIRSSHWAEVMKKISWDSRTSEMINLLDDTFAGEYAQVVGQ